MHPCDRTHRNIVHMEEFVQLTDHDLPFLAWRSQGDISWKCNVRCNPDLHVSVIIPFLCTHLICGLESK